MRKLLAILQIFVLMAAMALPTAFAAEAPIMLAGLEAASSSSSTEAQHDWDTNLFFQTMQEKTGIAFSFTEYVSREAWTEAKTEMLAGEVAMPDMFFKAELTPQETLAFYEAGKLIDLRPYLAEYAPHVWALLEANPEWMEAVSLPDGAIVALPSINDGGASSIPRPRHEPEWQPQRRNPAVLREHVGLALLGARIRHQCG